ncbi:hypothetical protein BS47DRAFT_588006 [Hydnum rufescens UP504]|uniref:Uncharacterized protein n=1 Tax=Hydnum rufescens UP504 TaxID=1448309 RepID=A0A9P6B3N4_9AGAM|nr:hypothetical protein BS47DRAFT_588006 [Hydnum rufescens UP504]
MTHVLIGRAGSYRHSNHHCILTAHTHSSPSPSSRPYMTANTTAVGLEILSHALTRPHFGVACDVDNIYSGKAKTAFHSGNRLPLEKQGSAVIFKPEDIDRGLALISYAAFSGLPKR